jgi:predicted ArsR family transcriptional regulator
MLRTNRDERFLQTTRGRILLLLRRSAMTADELADELELTDNAIRAHLTGLERDGLVRPEGVRHEGRVGKPATLYRLSPDAEPLFSSAYLPLLSATLSALAERLTGAELADFLREVGRRLAGSPAPPGGALADRVRAASARLNELGGLTTVEEAEPGARYFIRGSGCPLALAVAVRPEVCQAVAALVSELAGTEVRSCCAQAGRPSCCFEAGTRLPSSA